MKRQSSIVALVRAPCRYCHSACRQARRRERLVDTGFAECGFLSTRTFCTDILCSSVCQLRTIISPSHKAQRAAPDHPTSKELSPAMDYGRLPVV
jgi:hypothetical protein